MVPVIDPLFESHVAIHQLTAVIAIPRAPQLLDFATLCNWSQFGCKKVRFGVASQSNSA
jgi:hypothetical protein